MEDIDEEMENIPEEESPSLAMKIFSCCFQPRGKELELTSENPTSKRSKGIYESDDSFFPVNTLRPEEKAQITFTKNGLLDYIKNLQNLVFPSIFEDNNIKISKRNYTELNPNLPLYRFEVKKSKLIFTQVPTLISLANAFLNPELRKKWDKNIKEYKVIEKLRNNAEIIRTVTTKQLAVIPEKEFYDKRVGFMEGNDYYLFSSSVPDVNYLNVQNLDRGMYYVCVLVIKEDEDNFYFDAFIQVDINIKIPTEFIENNLFNKVNSFFDKYFEFLNVLK